MLTRKPLVPPMLQQGGDARLVLDAIARYLLSLNEKGVLEIREALGSFNALSSQLAPAGNVVVPAGYCSYVVDSYTIAASQYLEIGAGSVMEIG